MRHFLQHCGSAVINAVNELEKLSSCVVVVEKEVECSLRSSLLYCSL